MMDARTPAVQEETTRRPFSPSEVSTHDDLRSPYGGATSRSSSRKSRIYFLFIKSKFHINLF
jgi:hypothetical protein